MADEIVAVGGAGAGGGGSAPAGGGDGGAGGSGGGTPGGGAASAAPSSPATDEQILGMEEVGAAPAEAKPAAVPDSEQAKAAAAAAAKTAADGQKTPEQLKAEADAAVAEDGRVMPVKWRELAKTDPEFRTLFYTTKANGEKLAAIEPKFAEAQTTLAAVEKADQAYLSGDPIAIQGELKTFLAEKPEALEPMFEAGLNLLKQMHPERYDARLTQLTNETLKGWQFDKAFQVLRNSLDAGEEGLPMLKAQIEKMLEFADGNGFPTTQKAQIEARARELDQREATERTKDEQNFVQHSHTFRNGVNTQIKTTLQGEIKTSIDKLLDKAAFTDGAKARIAAEAGTEIDKMLGLNTGIIDQIGKAIWPNGSKSQDGKPIRGIFNDANKALAVQLPVEYAKTVLNDVLQKVIANYTKDFMATHQTADKRMAAAAGKTEVDGGASAPRAPKPLSKKDIDYSKMDDDAILNA